MPTYATSASLRASRHPGQSSREESQSRLHADKRAHPPNPDATPPPPVPTREPGDEAAPKPVHFHRLERRAIVFADVAANESRSRFASSRLPSALVMRAVRWEDGTVVATRPSTAWDRYACVASSAVSRVSGSSTTRVIVHPLGLGLVNQVKYVGGSAGSACSR